MPPIAAVLIAGPTASGKSALALAVARQTGGIVINADSMQVYAELAVLTARPGAADLALAPHALYGHVPIRTAYSVGHWLADAGTAIAQAHEQGRLPVIVGGTGLYFNALLDGISPVPGIPAQVREYWRAEAIRLRPALLHAELAARDPIMAARLRPSDPQRVTRALEVLAATGRSLASWHAQPGTPLLPRAETVRLVMALGRDDINARCDARFDQMLAAGAMSEASAIAALGLPAELPAMRATGLRELMAHVRGELAHADAVAAAKLATRRYAKRQQTWINSRMADWERVGPNDVDAVLARLQLA